MNLDEIVKRIREYKGVVRKGSITNVAMTLLPVEKDMILAAHGEDAAVIKCGREILLMAADGIMEDLVKRNPYWAGYCAVLVNVNDIAAMGGQSIAMVNVLSCPDEEVRESIVSGMKDACDKFGVPMVGGHLHPDTSYSAIDVAILGKTDRSRLVLSNGASPGESIVFAMDLDGKFTEGVPYSWDTTSGKSRKVIQRQLKTMNKLASFLTAGKDISNPGALGSLGMLLEASKVGGVVDISKIPMPPKTELLQWLTAYQGCGFVVTCKEGRETAVLDEFARSDIAAAVSGKVIQEPVLEIEQDGARRRLFDFRHDSLGCTTPQKI